MPFNKNTIIAYRIICGIVLVCGIVMSSLIDQLFKQSSSYDGYLFIHSTYPWTYGLTYIIPGLIGVIVSFTTQKGGFALQMLFAIMTLIGMGIFFIVELVHKSPLTVYSYTNCIEDVFGCVCSNGYQANAPFGSSCSDMNTFTSMAIGIIAMFIIGWIGCLAASITGGMLACAREDTLGVVIYQTHQPGVNVMHMGNMQPVAQPYVIQPGYGAQQNQYLGSPGYVAPPSYHTGYGRGSNYAPSNPEYDELGYSQKK